MKITGTTVKRMGMDTDCVVYEAESGCIYLPHRPLCWTGVDCTDASVVLWFKKY